jgi:hypothetical protein
MIAIRMLPNDQEQLQWPAPYPLASRFKARYVRIQPALVTDRRIAIVANPAFIWWG